MIAQHIRFLARAIAAGGEHGIAHIAFRFDDTGRQRDDLQTARVQRGGRAAAQVRAPEAIAIAVVFERDAVAGFGRARELIGGAVGPLGGQRCRKEQRRPVVLP